MSAKSTYLKNKSMFEKLKGTSGKIVPVKVVNQKKKTRRTNLTMINRTPFLPIKKWATLPYHETFKIATGANVETAGTMIWSLNGMYDPEFGIGGHQPMGFKQAMAFYEHYTVQSCKWTIQAYTGQSESKQSVAVGYYLSASTNIITESDRIVENGLMKRKIAPASSGNSRDVITLSGSLKLDKFFGKKTINEDDYRGQLTVNPQEQAYIVFFCNSLDILSSVDVVFDVTFQYTMLFTEPKKVPQS